LSTLCLRSKEGLGVQWANRRRASSSGVKKTFTRTKQRGNYASLATALYRGARLLPAAGLLFVWKVMGSISRGCHHIIDRPHNVGLSGIGAHFGSIRVR
jgi:hypothetical protein